MTQRLFLLSFFLSFLFNSALNTQADLFEEATNIDDIGSKVTKLLVQELRNEHYRSFKDREFHQRELKCARKEIERLNKLLNSRDRKETKSSEKAKQLVATSQVKESSKAEQRPKPKVSSGVEELNGEEIISCFAETVK